LSVPDGSYSRNVPDGSCSRNVPDGSYSGNVPDIFQILSDKQPVNHVVRFLFLIKQKIIIRRRYKFIKNRTDLMEVIPETYLMEVIPETYLMEVIPETYLMEVIPIRYAQNRVIGKHII
jgi:hypothetical protein